MRQQKFVAFDLETTGLDVVNDRILTAAVSGLPSGDVYLILNPGVPIPPEATAVHGLTDDFIRANGESYASGLARLGVLLLSAWATGSVVTGHNILDYDLPMLRMQERGVFGAPRTEIGPVFDTLPAFRKRFPGVPARLANACAHMGVELVNGHNAQADARAALELAYLLSDHSAA